MAYYGGKTMIAERIAALLPAHQHYVEPYCGSLSVLLAKQPAKMETVNDLDQELMTFWRVLRDRPDDLARACALTPHARVENALANDRGGLADLELSRRVWVKLSQGRALSLRRGISGGWKHYVYPAGSSVGMPDYLEAYVERMAAAAARLHAVSLECMPALDLIAKYGADPDVLLYADPPYLGGTRDGRNNYQHEMRGEVDHRALAEALTAAAAAVVISGYASDLYDRELYAGWDRHTIATSTGNSSGDRARVEVLWCNRPLGSQPTLFDAGGESAANAQVTQ
jgi:DNA adenine methylase